MAALSPAGMQEPKAEQAGAQAASPQLWTCSMHPQIRLPAPGRCPICGMELIPLVEKAGAKAGGPRELTLSEDAIALMNVETAPVERKFVPAEVRMVGKIDYDESRLKYITAWVGGRLDRLFVDYTGIPVKKGDHMVELYSPELYAAQEELIQAIKTVKNLEESASTFVRDSADETVKAAREKLRLLGLLPEQIDEIARQGEPTDRIVIYAPASGIVVHKNAQEGMYVNTGTRIYTIADLSQVWVRLDAYESDLKWLRYGQDVAFTAEAYPGETFHGTIFFIDPVLDEATRTVKVRVNTPNPDGRLKPGLFVRALVKAEVAAEGKVMDPDLAGKWICPMHPEVIEDDAGDCPICGMPLVRTESLGYETVHPSEKDKPLVIPATAPLITGKRAVVYVKVPGQAEPTFQGREIDLGPRAGDYYIVESGLEDGEQVVTRGNFKLDAELQIRGKPSMMSPEGGAMPGMPGMAGMAGMGGAPAVPPAEGAGAMPGMAGMSGMGGAPAVPPAEGAGAAAEKTAEPSPASPPAESAPRPFREELGAFVKSYLSVQEALASDDAAAATAAWSQAADALKEVDMKGLGAGDHEEWMRHAGQLKAILSRVQGGEDIEAVRKAFALLSEETAAVMSRFHPLGPGTLFKVHCPMAFDNRGASWIQADRKIRNPYFGSAMLRCGDVVQTYPANEAAAGGPPSGGEGGAHE